MSAAVCGEGRLEVAQILFDDARLMSGMSELSMTVAEIDAPGPDGALRIARRPVPAPGNGEVLIRVEAAGLNRGDIMQRIGRYPPPPGASDLPGLEVAGTVAALGEGVADFSIGDRVCAIMAGGGYGEYATAPAVQCLPLPDSLSMIEGAALPEALFTCWTNMVEDGRLVAGETVLLHGGASGIGVAGIQLARLLGARVIVTAGSPEKCAACISLGADLAINYHEEDFVAAVAQATGGRGVDLVLDIVGGDYVARSLETLAPRGRYVIIGLMQAMEASISLGPILQKRLTLCGSTLRGRSADEKGRIRDAVRERVWPSVAARQVKAIVHATFPLDEAAAAQHALETGDHIGKVVLATSHYATDAKQ
jgi:NADPH2:quinone reductase